MGVSYRLDPERGLTLIVVHGEVSADELVAGARRLISDHGYPPGLKQLTDLRTLGSPLDGDGMRTVAELLADRWTAVGTVGRAVLVGEDRTTGDQWQQLITTMGGSGTQVFDTLESACEWLDIDPEQTAADLDALRNEDR